MIYLDYSANTPADERVLAFPMMRNPMVNPMMSNWILIILSW